MTESAAVRRRRLTVELKRLRAAAGLTQREVAKRLDWSPSKVIRIEQGTVRIGVTDLQALLALYNVSDPETLEDLSAMARTSKRLPFGEYRDVMSAEAVRYLQYEADASIIRQVALTVVPGLLQTDDYAMAVLTACKVESARIEKLIESRHERRDLFERREPPELFFILDESVVRRTVGGTRVMASQIDHLVALAEQPRVSLQVLPFSVGAHAALGGGFIHLEFPAEDDLDVIFGESPLGDTLFRDDPVLAGTYRERFWELEDVATPAEGFEKFVRS